MAELDPNPLNLYAARARIENEAEAALLASGHWVRKWGVWWPIGEAPNAEERRAFPHDGWTLEHACATELRDHPVHTENEGKAAG